MKSDQSIVLLWQFLAQEILQISSVGRTEEVFYCRTDFKRAKEHHWCKNDKARSRQWGMHYCHSILYCTSISPFYISPSFSSIIRILAREKIMKKGVSYLFFLSSPYFLATCETFFIFPVLSLLFAWLDGFRQSWWIT